MSITASWGACEGCHVMMQGLTCDWQASKDWVTAANDVNIDFIAHHFGQAQVMVSNTTRYSQKPQ